MFPVAILAGGLATRLHPITRRIPKALIKVAGRAFICRQLDYLRRQGIAKVILCVGYLAEQIEAVVGSGRSFGIDVQYSYDGSTLMGTGGALRRALPLLGECFFVLYGDSYVQCDCRLVQQAFLQTGKTALMTVLRNENQMDKSNVLFRDGRILEYNKRTPRPEMAHIDYGLSVLSAGSLATYPDYQAFDLADIYNALSLADQLAGFEVSARFYEIGSPAGLKEAEKFLS